MYWAIGCVLVFIFAAAITFVICKRKKKHAANGRQNPEYAVPVQGAAPPGSYYPTAQPVQGYDQGGYYRYNDGRYGNDGYNGRNGRNGMGVAGGAAVGGLAGLAGGLFLGEAIADAGDHGGGDFGGGGGDFGGDGGGFAGDF